MVLFEKWSACNSTIVCSLCCVCPCKKCTKWFITSFLPPCLAFFTRKSLHFIQTLTDNDEFATDSKSQDTYLKSYRPSCNLYLILLKSQNSGKIVFLGKIVFSKNDHCQIVFLALYNCLLSSGQLSSVQWTIVFSKNKAVDNCLLKKMTTGKLSSEHWRIVFSKNGAVSNCLPRKMTTVKCQINWMRIT